MSAEKKQERNWWERLQHAYRLVIMNNETFEEIGSYKLSLLNVYILLSTLVVLVAALIWLAIIFTPVKRMVPGYGQVMEHSELLRMNRLIDSLENEFKVQQAYAESFRKILVNEVEYAPDAPDGKLPAVAPDTSLSVGRSEEDEILRREIELEDIREAAQLSRNTNFSPGDVPLEQLYFTPPVTGVISAGFMPEKKHFGVDVLAPKNTPVKAVMEGWVVASDWTLETGNTIGIQHANNIVTFYKHNSVLLKKTGQFVKAGEAVAIIGNTGTLSDGPHLHFELWHKGKPVNPEDFINFN